MDDAETMRPKTLDLVRRLTSYEMDGEDRVSILLAGTERLLMALREPSMGPLRTRFGYANQLRPFGVEDATNYVRYHLTTGGSHRRVFTDGAIQEAFNASQGVPRQLNQLALQALIDAVVQGADELDHRRMRRVLQSHPLYAAARG